jgi:hypothetical protein
VKLEDSEDRQSKAAVDGGDSSIPPACPARSEGVEETSDHDQMIKKVMYEIRGKHVFARVFMGVNPEEMTICGILMFKDVEFKAYRKVLEDGARVSSDLKVIFVDALNESNSRIPIVKD